MTIELSRTLAQAEQLIDSYRDLIADVPYEEKGVLFSEILFIAATVHNLDPKQVLESGRARGQSTYLLGLSLPETRIISVERYADSPDAPVAEKRVRNLPNVCTLYGESLTLLPALLQPHDIVFIDGPKGYRAVRLALRLLQTGKPACIFIHDMHKDLPERVFLEQFVPESFYSDDEQFVQCYQDLDSRCWDTISGDDLHGWQPYTFDGRKQASYGPTLACIPYKANRSYAQLLKRLAVSGFLTRMGRSIEKRKKKSRDTES